MYGSSDPGYQGTLQALTAKQRESNTARTAAHKAAQTETFMTGLEAKTNTVSQAACINELVWLIKRHPRELRRRLASGNLTAAEEKEIRERLKKIADDKQLPFVIAVDRWTPGMLVHGQWGDVGGLPTAPAAAWRQLPRQHRWAAPRIIVSAGRRGRGGGRRVVTRSDGANEHLHPGQPNALRLS